MAHGQCPASSANPSRCPRARTPGHTHPRDRRVLQVQSSRTSFPPRVRRGSPPAPITSLFAAKNASVTTPWRFTETWRGNGATRGPRKPIGPVELTTCDRLAGSTVGYISLAGVSGYNRRASSFPGLDDNTSAVAKRRGAGSARSSSFAVSGYGAASIHAFEPAPCTVQWALFTLPTTVEEC